MAIIKDGINGGFTGTVGTVSGYYLYGKWVIRAKRQPSLKNKIGSASQNACRSKFSLMQQFLKPIVGFVRIGFNMESKKRMMSAHNVAKSYNMLNAQHANGEIDYAKVCLTYGNLPGAIDVQLTVNDAGVHFSWANNTEGNFIRAHDQVMLMVYNVEDGIAHYETSGAKRSKQQESIKLSELDQGKTFHTWISFIAEDRQSIAMSTYCGSVVF